MPQEVQLFADKQIRTYWDDDKELYYFCIVDVVEALTDSNDPKQYIKRMRQRDSGLNSVWGTICTPHQFISSDGKRHQANCATLGGTCRSGLLLQEHVAQTYLDRCRHEERGLGPGAGENRFPPGRAHPSGQDGQHLV